MLVIVQALDFDISRNTQTNKFVDDFENNGHGNDNPEHNRGNTEQLDQEIMDTSAVKQTAVCCEQANTECSHGTAGTVYGNGTDRIINFCDAVKEINGYTQQDTCK